MKAKLLAYTLVLVLWGQPVLAAVSCSVLTSGSDANNATNYTTASVTPGANRLVLLIATSSRNTLNDCVANDISSITGNGLTWAAVDKQCFSTASIPTQTVQIWRSMGASPSSGAINFNVSSATQLNAAWIVVECDGVDTSGTNGSGAVAQSAINQVNPGTGLTVTLGAFGSANNATLGAFAIQNSEAITVGSGFTSLANPTQVDGGNNISLNAQWKTTNDTTVDASWVSSLDAGGVAIEIVASAAPPASDGEGEILWFP